MTRIKICCIASLEEARLAVAAGADAVGLVSEMLSGPGVIPEPLIGEIAAAVPPPTAVFLLTCLDDVDELAAQQRRCRANVLQLVDRVAPEVRTRLRDELPGVRIVQVVHVRDEASVEEAVATADTADALLLDSGDPSRPVKELGGTGRTHDWALSARIVREAPVPVILAGGLKPENVGEAVRAVRPFGVDVCSGVRTDGALDAAKLQAFVAAVRMTG